jgi:hypothetical protein
MFGDNIISPYGRKGCALTHINPRPDSPLVEVGFSVRQAGGKAHHGHDRDTQKKNDPDVWNALVTYRLENRVELDPVFNDDLIRLPPEAVHAAQDIGEMKLQFSPAYQQTVYFTVMFFRSTRDNQYSSASRPSRGFDGKISSGSDQTLPIFYLVFVRYDDIKFRNLNPG